jgi:cell division protease FtsH
MKITLFFLLSLPLVNTFTMNSGFFKKVTRLNSIPIRDPFPHHKQFKQYPLSKYHYEKYLKRVANQINNNNTQSEKLDEGEEMIQRLLNKNNTEPHQPGLRIIINKDMFSPFLNLENEDSDNEEHRDMFGRFRAGKRSERKSSENFEIVNESGVMFKDVGGYENVKKELEQCIDIISNYTKYSKYNVRVPKGLIFEGPPGNGKTLLAKALAGEANTSFIPVSGSQFQEKYVGVGSSRIRELFNLACDNIPCIVFIDEIDALGRKRSADGDISGNERDSTLNELLVALDGFKNITGVFLIGATNRADLLDDALLRPGRIDKRIFINNPDRETRQHILNIHLQGKPHEEDITIDELSENTAGFSGAQLENLVNEAMLLALRDNREIFSSKDLDVVFNKMIAGWQPSEHKFSKEMIDQIAIHELGHAVVGMLSKHHGKMTKVVINLSAPNTPAYTVFEPSSSNIVTREALFEHLMILLSGRIAEEVFYGVSVTTGAINDFQEALKLAEKMVCYYGMGKQIIYPNKSEKYKEIIDHEVETLLNDAYGYAEFILRNSKDLIFEGAEILKDNQLLKAETMIDLINTKYENVKLLKL